MAVIAKWNDHKFEVSPSVIRSFTALTFKGSSETEEKTSDGQKYVARKNGKPSEITLTAILDSRLGCDVRKEAVAWTNEARAGNTGYFYVYEKKNYYKLMPYKVMLTEADVTEVEMMPTGQWVKANVQLTLKQCAYGDGSSGGGSSGSGSGGGSSGSGSGGGYTKKSVVSTTPKVNNDIKEKIDKENKAEVHNEIKAEVNNATSEIKRMTTNAKKPTTTSKSLNLTRQPAGRRVAAKK